MNPRILVTGSRRWSDAARGVDQMAAAAWIRVLFFDYAAAVDEGVWM